MSKRVTGARDSRWICLVVLCVGMLMIVLDNTVVNVALPSIQHDMGFTQAGLAWVVNAYLIAFGGLLLLAGRLGDLIGSKRVFITGLVVFTAASLLCGVAWSAQVLVVARFVQGIGGAMASSVILAMIVTMFTDPGERARAMGVFSFTASAGGSVGLLLGGGITQLVNWHWVFLLNVPIGIAAFFVAVNALHDKGGIGLREGADLLGAALITASLMLAVYTVVDIPNSAMASAHTLLLGTIASVLFVAFIIRQATTRKPLLRLDVFTSRNVCGSNILQVLLAGGLFGFFFVDSLYLRSVLGYDAIATGFAFLPVTVSIGAFSLGWAARLTARFSARTVVVAGIAMGAAGLGIFALSPLDAGYFTTFFPAMLLIGSGLGMAFPSVMLFAMADATGSNSGLISGLINTTAQVGGAFGLAVLATLAAFRTHVALGTGASTIAALSSGYHLAFGVAAALVGLAVVVSATLLQPDKLEGHPQRSDQPATA